MVQVRSFFRGDRAKIFGLGLGLGKGLGLGLGKGLGLGLRCEVGWLSGWKKAAVLFPQLYFCSGVSSSSNYIYI